MHHCDLLVISCIDFRFQKALKDHLEKGFLNNYDIVCLAGSAKNLVSTVSCEREVLQKQIKISKELHGIKKIFLINHQNCGAYGAELVSGSVEEKSRHREDLIKANEQIRKIFPDLEVDTFFLEFDTDPSSGMRFTNLS